MKPAYGLLLSCSLLLGAQFASSAYAQAQESRFPKAIKHLQTQQKAASAQWLLDADDDMERFRRLQTAFGGSDMQMAQIGQRYFEIYHAIIRNNPEMALYHLEKIRDYMNVMGMKRPRRTPNLEGMFIESGTYASMREALESKDNQAMRQQFMAMRETCMACHIAERVGFLNDSSVFHQTKAFP